MKSLLRGLKRAAAIAHRGGGRAYPEYTLVAFETEVKVQGMDTLANRRRFHRSRGTAAETLGLIEHGVTAPHVHDDA